MKLEIDSTETVSTGVEDSWGCGIAENEIAFDTWSNTLYTRKERAIVRELSCNALDAHVAVGTPQRPFEIHLPTQHEPHFSINDFGTGLSHEEMKTLFSLYFGSNKRKSNKFIGALGLGSKSPFAYKGNGGMYTVISRKDGITRSYVATKKNGMPHMEQSGPPLETPNAPNGIMVQFAVNTKDIWTWENEAKVALEFITPAPKVNVANFKPKTYEYSLRTDRWGVRTEPHTAFGSQVRCIMGNVQYQLGDIDQSLIKSDVQKKILEMPIDMFFPLGALEFAPSREALQITEKTVNAVLAMCETVFSEIVGTVRAKIEACTTLWDAQILVWSLTNVNSTMGHLLTQALKKGKLYGNYTNFDFDERSAKIDALQYDHVGVPIFTHNSNATKRAKKSLLFMLDPGRARALRVLSKTDEQMKETYTFGVHVEPKTMFILNDTTQKSDKYVHFFLHESGHAGDKKVVYVIQSNASKRDTDVKKVVEEGKKLLASIGNPSYELLSHLVFKYPWLTKQRVGGTRGGYGLGRKRDVVVLKKQQSSKRTYAQLGWSRAWVTPDDAQLGATKKFYVVIDRLVASDTGFHDVWGLEEFVNMVRQSGKFGIDDSTPIYGVKRGSKALQNNKGEFVELMHHVFSGVKKYMTPIKTLSLSLYIKPFSSDCAELLKHIAVDKPLTDSPVQQFALALAEAKSIEEKNWVGLQKVLNFCEQRQKYTPGTVVNFNQKWQTIMANYPMLKYVGSYSFRNVHDRISAVEYIRLVDAENQREALTKAAASNS